MTMTPEEFQVWRDEKIERCLIDIKEKAYKALAKADELIERMRASESDRT